MVTHGNMREKFTISAFHVNILHTASLYMCAFVKGLAVGSTGPTLQDLVEVFRTDTEQVSYLLMCYGIGNLLGALGNTPLYKRYNIHHVNCLTALVSSVSFATVPFSRSLILACILVTIEGMFFAAMEIGASTFLVVAWGEQNRPFLQGFHFAFGLGAFIAPFLAEPFLSVLPRNQSLVLQSVLTANSSFSNTSFPASFIPKMLMRRKSRFHVKYCYLIIGILGLATFLFMLALNCINTASAIIQKSLHRRESISTDHKFTYTVVFLTAMFLFVYTSIEYAFAEFLASYAIKSDLQMKKVNSAFLTSVFFGMFTAFRCVGTFWSIRSTPACMLFTDQVVSCSAVVLLFVFGNDIEEVLWAGTALMGAGLAADYATSINLADKHIYLTGQIISFLTLFSGLGMVTLPVIVGKYIDDNPRMFIYSCGGLCFLNAGIVTIIWLVTRKRRKGYIESD